MSFSFLDVLNYQWHFAPSHTISFNQSLYDLDAFVGASCIECANTIQNTIEKSNDLKLYKYVKFGVGQVKMKIIANILREKCVFFLQTLFSKKTDKTNREYIFDQFVAQNTPELSVRFMSIIQSWFFWRFVQLWLFLSSFLDEQKFCSKIKRNCKFTWKIFVIDWSIESQKHTLFE